MEETQHAPDETRHAPAADLTDAVAWLALGVAVLVGSITMDRLEDQDVNPYTVPGLLPGLLGIALLLLGTLLMLRSLRRGGRLRLHGIMALHGGGRIALVIGLCVMFAVVLVGHGLPFWLAAALFVSVSILALQWKGLQPRAVAMACVIGLCAGGAITLVFQNIFLVRLP